MAASAIEIPRTGGAIRPITVVTKPGTVVHVAACPARRRCAAITGYRLSDVMNGALAQLVPDRVPAAGEGGSTLAFFTGRATASRGSTASSSSARGAAGRCRTATTGSRTRARAMANIPVEVAETEWPIVVERYGLVPDSGGAGRYPRRARGRARVALRRAGHDRARPLRPPGAPAVRPRRRRRGRGLVDADLPRRRRARADAADVRRRCSSPAT